MPDERGEYESVPIPTYEEATSAGPPRNVSRGPQSRHPRQERSRNDDAQFHRLLGFPPQDGPRQLPFRRPGNYEPATVESERSSYDTGYTSPEVSDDEDEHLREHMEEMDILDSVSERRAQQRPRGLRLPKPFLSLRQTLSFIRLPSLPRGFPTFSSLTSRLPSSPHHFKVPWPIVARLFGLFLMISMVYSLMVFGVIGNDRSLLQFSPQLLKEFMLDTVSEQKIRDYLWDISFDDHIAGTKGDFFLANQIKNHFIDAGLDGVFEENYEVYLNYPKKNGRRVAIVDPPELRWVAELEEGVAPEKSDQHQAAVFHGHSRSGNVTGPLIYANYGSRADFAHLKELGIDLTGAIVLVKYYGPQNDRALKVKAAELAGAAGCLIYSDPGDDGSYKGKTFPHGRWRPKDSVQRGSVSLMSWVVGDVLTPGWASEPGKKTNRMSRENNPGLVNIPSLPLPWRDAEVLLKALQGKGVRAQDEWIGGAKDEFEWWTGDLSSSPIVNLKNLQDDSERQPIRNILGRFQGFEAPEKTLYVGNHRDAWCFGAVDPGSGTAVMLEVVRAFGRLKRIGWRPRRSIVFASWDAEEYNLIGSTEHVEKHMDEIRSNGIAYLNLGSAVSGRNFWADGSPIFNTALRRALNWIEDPVEVNVTLLQKWDAGGSRIGGLGAGSDYVAFQNLAGCSSMDFGFQGPMYGFPYHSCYDSFKWMQTIGDPEFLYHGATARVLALLILELADEELVPFDLVNYADEVAGYVSKLEQDTAGKLNVTSLKEAAGALIKGAASINLWEMKFGEEHANMLLKGLKDAGRRMLHNERTTILETHMLDLAQGEKRKGGIPGRNQFKHVIFGPQAWSAYKEAHFPAVRDAVDNEDWEAAKVQVDIAAKVMKEAAKRLII